MSDLVVLDFDGTGTADEVLTRLREHAEGASHRSGGCLRRRSHGCRQAPGQAGGQSDQAGAATGFSTGMLIGALAGLLVLNPLAGMVVGGLSGAGFGALSGKMADYGINDDFIKGLGNTIPKGSSALFVLVKSSTPDKVLPDIEPYKPRVLKTSLSKQQEDKLRAALQTSAHAA